MDVRQFSTSASIGSGPGQSIGSPGLIAPPAPPTPGSAREEVMTMSQILSDAHGLMDLIDEALFGGPQPRAAHGIAQPVDKVVTDSVMFRLGMIRESSAELRGRIEMLLSRLR